MKLWPTMRINYTAGWGSGSLSLQTTFPRLSLLEMMVKAHNALARRTW